MLTDLKAQNAVAMRELGLEIPVEEVYNANGLSLKDAVVHFGGAQGAFAAVSNSITAVVVGGLLVLAYTRTTAKKGSLDQE